MERQIEPCPFCGCIPEVNGDVVTHRHNGEICIVDDTQYDIEKWNKRAEMNIEFKDAFDIVIKQLREDPGYYQAWQANIAVTFQDTLKWAGYQFPELHRLSNNSAKRFLDLLIDKKG